MLPALSLRLHVVLYYIHKLQNDGMVASIIGCYNGRAPSINRIPTLGYKVYAWACKGYVALFLWQFYGSNVRYIAWINHIELCGGG